MSQQVNTSETDWSIRLWAYDSDGAAVTGLVYNSTGIAVSVVVRAKGRIVSTTALTLVARSSAGVHTDSAFTEVGNGEYVVDLPDSYMATAERTISLTVAATAITGTVIVETLEVGRAAVLDSTALDEIKGSGWDASTDTLEKIRDAITLVSSISVVIPSPVSDVIGMPETLEIGDSYDEDTPIKLYVRDENDDPVTSFSGHDLTDPDFAPTFTIAPTPGSSRGRVVGTVTWVPAVGPVEGYLNVDIPSSQSRRAVEGESTVQCILKWDGYEKTILTTTVRWLPRI